jgi:hypothetical protein
MRRSTDPEEILKAAAAGPAKSGPEKEMAPAAITLLMNWRRVMPPGLVVPISQSHIASPPVVAGNPGWVEGTSPKCAFLNRQEALFGPVAYNRN